MRSRRGQQRIRRVGLIAAGTLLVVAVGIVVLYAHRTPPATAPGSQPTATTPQTAEAALRAALPPSRFSGVAAIYRNGQRIATLAQGEADRARHQPNSLHTMFEIDSVQKSLTAGLVMRAVVAKKLSLSAPLSDFYPQVPGATAITLRDMLNMTSGLQYHGSFATDPTYVDDSTTVRRLIAKLTYTTKAHGQWRYEPANYVLLAGIVAKVYNRSYQEAFTQAYMQGLGLAHTRFAYAADHRDMAQGYSWGKKGLSDAPLVKTPAHIQHQEFGTGQVFMRIDDLYHAESALLNGTLMPTGASAWLFAPGSLSTYGGGFYQQPQYRAANGYGYGFQCFVRITQSGRDAVIVMTNAGQANHQNQSAADALAQQWLP